MLFAFMAPPAAQAETVTVCPGTTFNEYVPLNGGGISSNSSRITSQMIYPAAKLSDVGISEGSVIKSITFSAYGSYTINKSNITSKTMVVKVGEVSNASVTATTLQNQSLIANATEVYNGTATFSSDGKQMTFTFSGDGYTWNGGDFAVQIYIEASGGNATDTYWAVQNATSGASGSRTYSTRTSKWNSAQIQSVLPQMEVTYETAEVKEYDAKVSPTSLAFGKMTPGEEATLNITVQNKGTNAITPSISGLSSPFSTTYTASSLASGETATIPVKFNPTIAGDWNETATISFGTTELDDVQVTLSGSAAYELTICDGTGTSSYLPVYGLYYDEYAQTNQMIYPAEKLSSMKGKRLKSMTFYSSSTRFFSNGTVTFSLANVDAGTTFTTAARTTPNDLTQVYSATPTVAQEWTINFDENANFVYNGDDLLVDVVTTTGDYNSVTFLGESGHNNASWYTSSSNGSGTIQNFLPMVTFTFENSETPAPVISGTVTPTTLDFGTVTVGENGTATITVTNTGNTAFTPGFSTLEAPFSIEEATEIAAGESKVFTVTYHPTAAGDANSSFTVTIGEQEPITVTMTGTATAKPYAVTVNPENGYDFGNVIVNNSKVWTLTITNNGTNSVTPTLSALEAPFTTNYPAAALSAGQSVNIEITFTPTEKTNYSSPLTLSFPEANGAIASYTYELTGKGVDSFEPTADNEVVKLVTVDKQSIYVPDFIDTANGNTTPQQLNCYDMRFKMAQPDDPAKQIKAGDLHPGNNLYEFYAIDDFGTEFRFATINLYAEGQPSSNPSVSAMDAPIVVTPSVEYYTEDGMPVHPDHKHYTTLNYTEKTYNDINELVDLEGVIDYVNDTWSANTATNAHPDHYKFQIRGVGQYGDLVTSLTAEYVESHMTGYGDQLVMPEGWERGMFAGPNNEASDNVHTFYYYDLYIKKSFFDERGITGPVTVVVNTTLSGSGFNADNYKAMSVNGVEQIIAKEEFKDYSWTVPLLDSIPTPSNVEHVSMGVIIRLVSTGADFNRTRYINIYGGGTGVSNIDTVGIYKSSMNVKAYTQKQVDEDTDRNLVAMKNGDTETNAADVNVLAYADPAVTGYTLYENSSASTSGMTQVATATHNANGSYSVNSVSQYTATYDYERDESLGNIDGRWLPMYPADASKYFLPVTTANGVGDDGVVRSEGNTYGSAMQQVEENGSVTFSSSKCYKGYTWTKDNVKYALYSPEVNLTSTLPTGYELYNYRLWIDYEDDAPAWDFESIGGKINLTDKMDRPLYYGTETHIGGEGREGRKDDWAFVAPDDLEEVKLVARFYYKKSTASHAPGLKARPTDSDRLYYVVENQVKIPTENIVTGIDNVLNKTVANVKYYNLMGVESATPFQGVNIVVTTYDDGTRSSRKVIK